MTPGTSTPDQTPTIPGGDPMTHSPVVRRFLLVALVLPLAMTLVGLLAQLVVLGDLPDPVAVHWGVGGDPDGFADPTTSVLGFAALGLGLPVLLALGCWPGLRVGDYGPTYRLLGATSAATTTLLVLLVTGLTVMQAGLADARDAGSVWTPLLGAVVTSVVVAVGAWRLLPAAEEQHRATTVAPIAVAPSERVAWLRTTTIPTTWAVLLVALDAGLLLLAGALWLFEGSAALGPLLVALVVIVTSLLTTSFRVRADASGLTVRSALGLPRFRVPLDDITSVGVLEIRGMGDYGGWGIRWMPGRLGVLLRRGEAIEVTRHSGRRFAVTVDDAATGAAVLQAHLDR